MTLTEPMMVALAIGLAFATGFAAQMVRLPPLVGFLAAGTHPCGQARQALHVIGRPL